MLPAGDAELVRIVDAALLDATVRSGHWLACRPGCNQCCTGVFRVSQLDAERLRHGLRLLQQTDPPASIRLQHRIHNTRSALTVDFPGDPITGVLHESELADELFDSFANDAVCPVLEPSTSTCTLYQHRPLTCRTFGPPVATEDGGLGTCELCFQGASNGEVQAAEMHLPPAELEDRLLTEVPRSGQTIVAFAFDQPLV